MSGARPCRWGHDAAIRCPDCKGRAPITSETVFPLQDPQAIHAIAAAAIEGITDTAERDRIYTLARAEAVRGLTVRDWFAGEALQGMLAGHFAHHGHEHYWGRADIADEAFGMADAMLAARAAKPAPTAAEAQRDQLLGVLRDIGGYRGEGASTTPWQDIVRDIGQMARDVVAAIEGAR